MSQCLLLNSTTSGTTARQLSSVRRLANWDLDTFKNVAYNPSQPAHLPCLTETFSQASKKWFIYDAKGQGSVDEGKESPAELDLEFWEAHSQVTVPLEVTKYPDTIASHATFEKVEAPLSLFVQYLQASRSGTPQDHRIYLAQHDLRDLPQALQDDLPTPDLVLKAGKGDLYSSSLWLGRPPTYTPLHRDPNPNLFMQLAGTKVVRLVSPEIGNAIYEFAMRSIQVSEPTSQSAVFRGEEMMQGPERAVLEDLVWGSEQSSDTTTIQNHMLEARLHASEALFIPKGWWHSVKGVGAGVTASANWWFR